MNLNSGPKNSPMCQIWAWSSNYLENNSSFFVFSTQKMTWHTRNKRLLWQHLTTMVIDKMRKMSIKGVKLKSESFFLISPVVLELWRKNLSGGGFRPPGPDRVKMPTCTIQGGLYLFHYVLDNLNWLLFVFLSNLIINLMYNIKKLYFNDQHKFRV